MNGRFTWRKGSRGPFLTSPRTYELRFGGKHIATAQETSGGWFWYGGEINTSRSPQPLEDVKIYAVAYFKANPQEMDEIT